MTPRPPLTWFAALTGLAVQAVVLVVLTVYVVHEATLDSTDATNLGDAVFRDLFGPVVFGALAVATGLLALLAIAALLLSIRRGGRLTGLIISVVLQVPLVGSAVLALDGGAGAGEVATLVGGALVLVGAVVPATWRWCRLPAGDVQEPGPGSA